MHSLQTVLIFVGIVAFGLFLAGWAAYPVALRLLRPRRRAEAPKQPGVGELPFVDIIIATREQGPAVLARVRDALDGDYPADRLRVFVGVDVTSPTPLLEVRELLKGLPVVEIVSGDPPGGKAAALNAAVRAGRGEILVFTDTAQRFDRAAISELVRCIASKQVGGASGYLRAWGDRGALGRFWSYETLLRELESDLDSLVGVTGAVYGLRREAWPGLHAGLINDDLAVPLLARRAGFRVLHCPTAEAFDDRSFPRARQFDRRVRTLTGIYQMLAWYPWLLSPWSNPLWVQFLLHKIVRLITPFLLGMTALALVAAGWTSVLLLGLVCLVAGAFLGAMLVKRSPADALTEIVWAFGLLFGAPVAAAINALRGDWMVWSGPPSAPKKAPNA